MTPADRFWYTVDERERIRLAREAGRPGPWSPDPVFQRARFCNVWREHDKTSVVIHDILRQVRHDLRPAMAICLRLVNRHATLVHFDPAREVLAEMGRMVGIGIHTNAYRINTPLGLNSKAGVLQLVESALGAAPDLYLALGAASTFGEYHRRQGAISGVSSFIGYQAALDLRDLGMTHRLEDDWVHVGPGAVRGMLWLRGEVLVASWEKRGERSWSEAEYSRNRPDRNPRLAAECRALLPGLTAQGRERHGPRWSIHETEGWLCEFDRYERARERLGLHPS